MSTRAKLIVGFRVVGIGLVIAGLIMLVRTYQIAHSPEMAWVSKMMGDLKADAALSLSRADYTPALLWIGIGVAVAALSRTLVSFVFRGVESETAPDRQRT